MDNKILKSIITRKELFVPLIFTEKQFEVLKKYNQQKKLSNAEKKALYTSITKKIKALNSLYAEQKDKEYYINGITEILPERINEAKSIFDKYSKVYEKVFVSGSFLFSKEYKDIDVFIIQKRGYKEEFDENKHLIFLTEKKLTQPIFQSASLISVSNFIIKRKLVKKEPSLAELMGTYHEAVIEIMRRMMMRKNMQSKKQEKEEKQEAIRQLIFDYYLLQKNKLLNGKELKNIASNIRLENLDLFIKELCRRLFSEKYLYVEIHTYIKTLEESIKNIKPNKHLIRFKNTYEEMIYGKQRSKAEAA